MQTTPHSLSYRQPAEWETHTSCWVAWPSHPELWLEELPAAQSEFAALCRAITGVDAPEAEGEPKDQKVRPEERLEVLVPDEDRKREAEMALRGLPCRFHLIPFGDIWLRDTGPVFVRSEQGLAGVRFAFNGWGKKYLLPHDDTVSSAILRASGQKEFSFPWILEGGSVEVDGQGTCLTTRQCLLNPNRNPGLSEKQIEGGLKAALGIEKTIWLEEGLIHDHTDGHIDTLARFTAPATVVCMDPSGPDDPNKIALEAIYRTLSSASDAQGRKLNVIRVPSPGRVENAHGKLMPASYLNFYIANRTVVVPLYGSPFDQAATEAIGACFPGRHTVGLPAKAILNGGGAFHCITQQQPLP